MSDASKLRVSLGALVGGLVVIIGMFGTILKETSNLEARLTKIETVLGCHTNPANCGNATAGK